MNKFTVSIVVPVHNGERTLGECLSSILKQDYENYEVIVVDNNSNDKTREIIKDFEREDKRVRYIFESRRGRGAARNAGIREAKGEIIVMTDCDCIVPENWIERLTEPIIKENESAVMGFEESAEDNYWARNIQKANWQFLKRNLNGRYINHVDTKNFAIKSEIIKRLMFDSNLGNFEDLDLYLRMRKMFRVRFDSSIKVKHAHKNSFFSFVRNNLNRGYWTMRVLDKHGRENVNFEPMFESISAKNFISFPFWMTLQTIKNPTSAFFTLVSESSWRAGLLLGMIK